MNHSYRVIFSHPSIGQVTANFVTLRHATEQAEALRRKGYTCLIQVREIGESEWKNL